MEQYLPMIKINSGWIPVCSATYSFFAAEKCIKDYVEEHYGKNYSMYKFKILIRDVSDWRLYCEG